MNCLQLRQQEKGFTSSATFPQVLALALVLGAGNSPGSLTGDYDNSCKEKHHLYKILFWNIILPSTRFENIVTSQFYGHTHNDEFIVFYDFEETNDRATNIAYTAPGTTTWKNLNPSYRIYTLDGPYEGASMVKSPGTWTEMKYNYIIRFFSVY